MGKLKSGHGDAVCQVLHTLMGEALRRVSFEFHAPTYPDEGMADEADVDSDAEIHSPRQDEMPGDGEEDDLIEFEEKLPSYWPQYIDPTVYRFQEDAPKPPEDDENDHQVLQANVDPKEWLLEVERVSSRLKVQMPNDSKEWRTHLQQTKQYKQVIENQFPASKVQLDKLVAQLSQAMDRIKSKEAFINTQFDHRAVDYRQQQEELTQVQQQYTELNEVVMNLQIELKNVREVLYGDRHHPDRQDEGCLQTTQGGHAAAGGANWCGEPHSDAGMEQADASLCRAFWFLALLSGSALSAPLMRGGGLYVVHATALLTMSLSWALCGLGGVFPHWAAPLFWAFGVGSFGVAFGVLSPCFGALISSRAPKELQGQIFGLSIVVGTLLGMPLGPLWSQVLFDPSAQNWRATLPWFVSAGLLSFTAVWFSVISWRRSTD
eukprot:g31776.t1